MTNKNHPLRQSLRGWARNLGGSYKKDHPQLINMLEIKAEQVPLTVVECVAKRAADKRIAKFM